VSVTSGEGVFPNQGERDAEKAAKVREKLAAEGEELRRGMDAEVANGDAAATKNRLREILGWQAKRVTDVIDRLLCDRTVEEIKFMKTVGNGGQREVTGYRRRVEGALFSTE